jgi:c-di-GMP-binding flagellar brake protein YcgR
VTDRERTSWLHQLIARLTGQPVEPPAPTIDPDQIVQLSVASEPRRGEDWRDLLPPGRRVQVTWVADGDHAEVPRASVDALTVNGEVRIVTSDTFWVWFDCDVPRARCPEVGQAIQVFASGPDALRRVPCRVIEDSRGGSVLLAVSGRISRVQRREDVRTTVDLPPVSAVRLGADDGAVGLVGVHLLNLSAGGVRFQTREPLRPVERLRLVLRLDDGPPLTPTVEVVEPGTVARGRFSLMPERDRRRIVQYVYHRELAARPASDGDRK